MFKPNSVPYKNSKTSGNSEGDEGIIGRYYEGDLPIVVAFTSELPAESIRRLYITMVVVSWQYDGRDNNGMPLPGTNAKMILLEDALEDIAETSILAIRAYSRTGNNLKEFVYYTRSQDEFIMSMNKKLAVHERYPIEITFYEDPHWSELAKLIKDFK